MATLGISVAGAFLLGVLLELLADHTLDRGWSRRIRLGVGTGGLGGFTTVSRARRRNRNPRRRPSRPRDRTPSAPCSSARQRPSPESGCPAAICVPR